MPVRRLHAIDSAAVAAPTKEGRAAKPATRKTAQRQSDRRARQANTRPESAEMLRQALRLAGVSRSQFAGWLGLSDGVFDAILAGEKPLAADDLLTPHPGVRRVAAIYYQLAASHLAGAASTSAARVPARDQAVLAVETLGELLRTEREAMADGVLDVGEVRALDGLCVRAIDLLATTRDAIRATAGGR